MSGPERDRGSLTGPAPSAQEAALLAKIPEILQLAKSLENDPERFKVYDTDPLGFALDILGLPTWSELEPEVPGLTPQQVELLQAVARGDRRVAVRSGHGTGKSFILAVLTLWWLYGRRGLVVTTASTWDQVEQVLWRQIAELQQGARVKLPGEMLQTELRVDKSWYAVGVSTNNPTSFQGRHHPRLLVIVDEAPGVEENIHEAIATLATGDKNCIVMVGNPTSSSGSFYEAFRKGGWTRLHFSCYDHPNVLLGREVIPGAVTESWIREAEERWGIGSPIFASRVTGDFPTGGSNNVIPISWADRAQDAARYAQALAEIPDKEPSIIAADIARYGDNKCVLAVRQGGLVHELQDWGQLDTMQTVGLIVQAWERWQSQQIVIDEVGLGGGVLDRLIELGLPAVGFNSGRAAASKSLFQNRRSELWWTFRELLEADEVRLPEHEQLRMDLIAPTFTIGSTGKIAVERKEELKARGVQSPDYADAVIMAFSVTPVPEQMEPGDRIKLGQDATLILASQDDTTWGGPMGGLSEGF